MLDKKARKSRKGLNSTPAPLEEEGGGGAIPESDKTSTSHRCKVIGIVAAPFVQVTVVFVPVKRRLAVIGPSGISIFDGGYFLTPTLRWVQWMGCVRR